MILVLKKITIQPSSFQLICMCLFAACRWVWLSSCLSGQGCRCRYQEVYFYPVCLCRHPARWEGANPHRREAWWSPAASGRTDHPALRAARLQAGRPENAAGVWGAPVPTLQPADGQTFLSHAAALHDLRARGRHGEGLSSSITFFNAVNV